MTDETTVNEEEVVETSPEATPETETAPEVETEAPAVPVNTALPYVAKLVNVSELRSGQTVRLHERIKDISPKGEVRERVQVFEGIITGLKGAGLSKTITLRKISAGDYAVEKIYPLNSPVIAKIELVKTAKVRRAKLAFLTNQKRRFERKFKETYIK